MLYEAWTTSDRGGSFPIPSHNHKLHPGYTQLLTWILEPGAWTMDLISGVVVQWCWCRYGYSIPPFHECFMRHGPHLIGVDHPTDHHMITNYTLDTLSCYPGYWNTGFLELWSSSLVLGSKDNNPDMYMISYHSISVIWGMKYVWLGWITPQTTIWPQTTPLYELLTIFDRDGPPPRPPHDLQLNPRHTQLLPWILE